MRTTIVGAGRVVIPKPLRDAAGLKAGSELEVEVRDGRIEIEPAPVSMRLGPDGVVETVSGDVPSALSADEVRALLETTRR